MEGAEEEDVDNSYSTSQLEDDDSDDEATNEDIDKLKVALRNEKVSKHPEPPSRCALNR
jgi:hypothetical protein